MTTNSTQNKGISSILFLSCTGCSSCTFSACCSKSWSWVVELTSLENQMPSRETGTSSGAHGNLHRYNKAKWRVLHLGQGNSQNQYRLGKEGFVWEQLCWEELLGTSEWKAEHELGLCARDSESHVLGCVIKSLTGSWREPILPTLLGFCETPPGVLQPALESSAQQQHGPIGVGPEEGQKNDGWNIFLMKTG